MLQQKTIIYEVYEMLSLRMAFARHFAEVNHIWGFRNFIHHNGLLGTSNIYQYQKLSCDVQYCCFSVDIWYLKSFILCKTYCSYCCGLEISKMFVPDCSQMNFLGTLLYFLKTAFIFFKVSCCINKIYI